jgi:hypothetical protein
METWDRDRVKAWVLTLGFCEGIRRGFEGLNGGDLVALLSGPVDDLSSLGLNHLQIKALLRKISELRDEEQVHAVRSTTD